MFREKNEAAAVLHCFPLENESVHFCIAMPCNPPCQNVQHCWVWGVILCIRPLLPHYIVVYVMRYMEPGIKMRGVIQCIGDLLHCIIMRYMAPGIKIGGVIQCIGDVRRSGRYVCSPIKQPLLLLNISTHIYLNYSNLIDFI